MVLVSSRYSMFFVCFCFCKWLFPMIKSYKSPVRQPAATCIKRLPDNSTIFAAEATAITLALNYYRYMGPVHHEVVVYSDSMSYLAGDRGWRYWEPFYLPYHEPPLVIEWQRHTCAFLLDTEPLWHRGKRKSWPASKRDPWPWHRPTCKCPPCRFEAIGQLLYRKIGSNQEGCGCTW